MSKYIKLALIGLFVLLIAPASAWAQPANPFAPPIPPPPAGKTPKATPPKAPPKGNTARPTGRTYRPQTKKTDTPDVCPLTGKAPDPATGKCETLDEVLAERDKKRDEELKKEALTEARIWMGGAILLCLICLILTILVWRRSENRDEKHIELIEKLDERVKTLEQARLLEASGERRTDEDAA